MQLLYSESAPLRQERVFHIELASSMLLRRSIERCQEFSWTSDRLVMNLTVEKARIIVRFTGTGPKFPAPKAKEHQSACF